MIMIKISVGLWVIELFFPVMVWSLVMEYCLLLKVSEFQLGALSELSEEFGVESLVVHCEQMKDALKDTPLRKDHKLELLHSSPVTFLRNCPTFSSDLPIDVQKLKILLETGKHSDVDVYVEGHDLVVQGHKIVLSV